MAAPSGSTSGGGKEGSAKAIVADQITQAARLTKLPRSLLDKTFTIKNTEQVLEQLPQVISALDAHMDSGLQSVPHLETVIQLLANMESCQLKPLSKAQFSCEGAEILDQPPEAD
ncbi:hypothetical protein RJ639_025227 [Escallonia herrerae]|uniref:Uncharacterized protein n=1 Tax=Escallonia herrerae TaxID=1293975 RepID=A0AA89ABR0_9ASTE|nr:hypothetical protein RJ639_025227 [Escallonia herrerae]